MRLNLPTPVRALAVAAHPDDAEFGAGGTLAKWAANGCVISFVICTDGSKGSWDPDEDPAALVLQRQREQRAAAKALGATDESAVVFLGRVDGELQPGLDERREVARAIRELRPEVVLGHDPWRRYRLHPDHRNAGQLAVDAVVAARDPHFYPDLGLDHWRPSALLLWEADVVDHVEDVTATVETKLAALYQHESQLRSTMHIAVGTGDETEERASFERRLRERLATFGRQAGVAYGEGFKIIPDL